MSKSALAKIEEPGSLLTLFSANGIDIQSVGEAMQEAAGSGGVAMSDLERVRIPAGGGTSWSLTDPTGAEIEAKAITGAIVGDTEVRAYWREAFSGGSQPPDCFSPDLETGIGNPGGDCTTCPMAAFGSKNGGPGQACAHRRVLLILTPDTALPRVISVPPSSLKRVRQSFLRAAGMGKAPSKCVWSFGLAKEKNAAGIIYSALDVTYVRDLTPDEQKLVSSFRAAFDPSSVREIVEQD